MLTKYTNSSSFLKPPEQIHYWIVLCSGNSVCLIFLLDNSYFLSLIFLVGTIILLKVVDFEKLQLMMDLSCLRPITLPSSPSSGLLLGVRISCLARLQLFWRWIHSDFQNRKILNWYGDLPRPRSRCASCSPSLSWYKSCVRCNSGQWFSLLFIFSRSKDPLVNYYGCYFETWHKLNWLIKRAKPSWRPMRGFWS